MKIICNNPIKSGWKPYLISPENEQPYILTGAYGTAWGLERNDHRFGLPRELLTKLRINDGAVAITNPIVYLELRTIALTKRTTAAMFFNFEDVSSGQTYTTNAAGMFGIMQALQQGELEWVDRKICGTFTFLKAGSEVTLVFISNPKFNNNMNASDSDAATLGEDDLDEILDSGLKL